MSSSDRLINNYTCKYSNKIGRITELLKISLGISEFWHYSIHPNGDFSYLANHPDISSYYWGLSLYKKCPLFRHPDNFESIVILTNSLKDERYTESQDEVQKKFNMQLPFNIIRKEKGICHGFGFATRNPNFPLDSLCINHLSRLNKFCDYFLTEAAPIENKMLEDHFNLSELVGKSFYLHSKPLMDVPVNLKDFYKKLKQSNSWVGEEPRLTKRERECLSYFLKGHTCREIGSELNLSIRTIEAYFVSIKRKFNCNTRSELFASVQEFEQFGLL